MNQNAPSAQIAALRDVRTMLASDTARKQIAMVAAKHMSPERMTRIVANAARTTPKLYECEPTSLLGAMMTCASLGLEPNTVQGHAFLVPFRNTRKEITEAQLIIGYKGFIDLAFRSGILTYIDAGVHYSDDDLWVYEKGQSFTLRHAEGPQKGDKLHAYAIAKWQNPGGGEGTSAVVLPWSKVIAVRDGSQNWKQAVQYKKTHLSPWGTNEDQMAMKTAIRALAQSGRLPMSLEMKTALAIDGSQSVDYAKYATEGAKELPPMSTQPDEPEPEGQMIEGEAVEQEKPSEEEKPKRPAKAATPKEEAAPAAEQKAQEEKPAPSSAPDEGAKLARQHADSLMADLLDGGPARKEAILAENAAWVEILQEKFPALWADVQATIEGL